VNRAEIARAIVACEAMAKQLRVALEADALAEYEEQGTVPTWRLPGLKVVGSTTNDAAYVADEQTFLAWVQDRYPSEVETVTLTRVRPVWQKAFLADVAKRGDPPCDLDGEAVPGVRWIPGGAFGGLAFRPDPSLKALVREHAREIVAGTRPLELPSQVPA